MESSYSIEGMAADGANSMVRTGTEAPLEQIAKKTVEDLIREKQRKRQALQAQQNAQQCPSNDDCSNCDFSASEADQLLAQGRAGAGQQPDKAPCEAASQPASAAAARPEAQKSQTQRPKQAQREQNSISIPANIPRPAYDDDTQSDSFDSMKKQPVSIPRTGDLNQRVFILMQENKKLSGQNFELSNELQRQVQENQRLRAQLGGGGRSAAGGADVTTVSIMHELQALRAILK